MDSTIHVLIVDDSQADVKLLRKALLEECAQCEVTSVDDGEKATEYLLGQGRYADAQRPDLLILDLNLPRLDGNEILKLLNSSPALSKIVVVVLSTSPKLISRAALLHPDSYFQKPSDLDEFISLGKNIIKHFQSVRGVGA